MSELHGAFSVLGLPVNVMSNYLDWLLERLRQGSGGHVITLNAEMTMQAERNQSLAKVIHDAELVIPDGAGVVLYLKLMLRQKVERIPGIELAEDLLKNLGGKNIDKKVFFYGGAAGIATKAAESWRQEVPGLNVIGTYSGYHSPAEAEELRQTLIKLQPDVIFVGLGVPRQEMWIHQNRQLCPQAIWIGVGGSFDIWAGQKTRAPQWLANNNLEWLYRLYQEPWRWRRMLALPEFACKALVSGISEKLRISQSLS
ncbi:WecB/TagA/CpsF family glycosyltransferase [Calothrix rhizosoleniae]|uniref:WecB/TagA/CpsF family glycosyltransferase n=1 Tax=Calothrix rhizosoleniae TaxID=888997 RepID=UPI000B49D5FA|nr:WecB/TagA/CpsF family glycosyltransferase [Calothrix rhizosoleniae]